MSTTEEAWLKEADASKDKWLVALGRFIYLHKVARFPDDVEEVYIQRDAALARAEAAEARERSCLEKDAVRIEALTALEAERDALLQALLGADGLPRPLGPHGGEDVRTRT